MLFSISQEGSREMSGWKVEEVDGWAGRRNSFGIGQDSKPFHVLKILIPLFDLKYTNI